MKYQTRLFSSIGLLLILSLVASACGGQAAPTAAPSGGQTEATAEPAPAATEVAATTAPPAPAEQPKQIVVGYAQIVRSLDHRFRFAAKREA